MLAAAFASCSAFRMFGVVLVEWIGDSATVLEGSLVLEGNVVIDGYWNASDPLWLNPMEVWTQIRKNDEVRRRNRPPYL